MSVDLEQLRITLTEHAAMKAAIATLFAVGGAGGMEDQEPRPLPVSTRRDGPWQAPGTVAVRVDALRRLAKAGGIG